MSLSAVSQTALLTLRARAEEHARADRVFADPIAADWSERLPWPAPIARAYAPFTQVKTIVRAHQFDTLLAALLDRSREDTTVVELGGGFTTRAQRIERAHARWVVIDLPPVIEARRALGDRTDMVAASVLDPQWMETLAATRVIWVAEGLLYYLPRAEVDGLLRAMATRWPDSPMVLDVIGARDFRPSVAATRRLDAPIAWHVDPPFAAARAALGLSPIDGFDLEAIMRDTIRGFGRRYGPLLEAGLNIATQLPFLRERRSGIMVGALGSDQRAQ